MTFANVNLANTFDQWRTVTNQLVVLGNNITENNVLKFVTNSASLYVSASANAGETVSINVGLSNVVTDTSKTNIAAAGSVNTTYALATQALNAAVAAYQNSNTKFTTAGGTITGDVTITGNLTMYGNTLNVFTGTLKVSDPLIYLAANNYSSDFINIGIVGNYVNTTGSNVHTGLYRQATVKEWYLFQGYDQEPGVTNNIDPSGNNFQLAFLNANLRTSNIILAGQNTVDWINAAFAQANNTGAGSNAYANLVWSRVNTYFGNIYTTIAGANSVANGWTNTVWGYANTTIGAGANSVGSAAFARSNNSSNGVMRTAVNGTTTGFSNNRNFLNFNESTTVLVTVADDSAGNRANVTFTANSVVPNVSTQAGATFTGNLITTGTIKDTRSGSTFDVRSESLRTAATSSVSGYELSNTDAGRFITVSCGFVFVPAGNVALPFALGDVVRIFNSNASAIKVGVNAAANVITSNNNSIAVNAQRNLGPNGVATLTYISSNVYIIRGDIY
jgi:hypothetical protein